MSLDKREFTTLLDSYGTKIYEGDIIEFYDWCYCNEGTYQEGEWCDDATKLGDDFIKRAIENGYTVKHEYRFGKSFIMHKPCTGIIKWNSYFVTYEPIVNSQEDYTNNSFHYVVRECGSDGAYCKVIGNVIDNPDLARKVTKNPTQFIGGSMSELGKQKM